MVRDAVRESRVTILLLLNAGYSDCKPGKRGSTLKPPAGDEVA